MAILLLAALVRLGYLWYYSTLPDWTQLTVDNWYHLHWAQSIAAGNVIGDTTYFRAPFYVWCLGLLYAVFGSSLWVARLFGAAVGVLSVFLTYRIGSRLFSKQIGRIAAVLQAVTPVMMYFEGELLLDPLFTLLLQIAIYRLLVWLDEQTSRHALAA
ncbi:MAG: hypothetical protein D6800_13560, partial [Candidatus Zixiibacteriota bacterium]